MHDREKSDRPVLPARLPNNPAQAGAEVVEGRGLPEGNTASEPRPGPSAEIYGTEASPHLISKITDTVLADAKAWQNRPLERV